MVLWMSYVHVTIITVLYLHAYIMLDFFPSFLF